MDNLNFYFKNIRVAKARFSRKHGMTVKIICIVLIALIVLAGVGSYLTMPEGSYRGIETIIISVLWPLLLIAGPAMIMIWLSGDLERNLPIGKDLTGMLDGKLLGYLPDNPSPRDIATALANTNGGKFFANRFGIPPNILIEQSSTNPQDTTVIWQDTARIYENLPEKGETISSAIVVAALIRSQPALLQILPQLQIDENDIIQGAQWYCHLSEEIKRFKVPKLTGGIARDWSFGYIPTLEKFGTNLSAMYAGGHGASLEMESYGQLVDAMVQTFSSGGRQNVALIGPIGSGKTSVVEAFAERLMDAGGNLPKNLQFRQVFSLDSAALLGAAPGRGEIEVLVNRLLYEAFKAKNIILCLDNAQLFFEDGVGSIDITNILLPVLEGGGLRMILTMEEQRFLQISQRNPAVSAALNRLQVNPPNEASTMRIMQDQAVRIEYEKKVLFTYQSLVECYRLSERYIQDIFQPKRAITMMESAADKADGGLVTPESARNAIESTLGVKTGATENVAERTQLLNLEDQIHQRMINQTAAVNVVSAALRRARAGVRSEKRPIGTFLFLGPTGVGKTELAKTLSEVYFGGEGNMVRIDMNEYVRPDDVARLIADGANDANSLAAQVMKNPFSVVLLDEIEKAHPNVLSTLLQVLDEGILRDINNREISFRDAILIATSNAGSIKIREYIDQGLAVEQFEEQFKDELINSQQFTPEFLNRFDEIVVFRPLTKEELVQVVDLMIGGVNKTLANQKVSVNVSDDAKIALVDAGYDPRLGARPMRRVVQRTVENIVSQKLLSGELQPGMTLDITLEDIKNTGELDKNPAENNS